LIKTLVFMNHPMVIKLQFSNDTDGFFGLSLMILIAFPIFSF